MTLLLLSGCPGAGKTEVSKWLETHRGFKRVETDAEPAGSKWWQLLKASLRPEGAAAMRNEAQALGSKVVVEWGFRVDLLGWVHQLRAAGFDAWWLDGDEEAARQGFIKRRGDSPVMMDAYRAQAKAIQANWPNLAAFYGDDHIIRTVTSGPTGPTYLTCEEIASIMLRDPEPT